MLHRYNEGKTIDAVLRLIENREQQRRAPDGRSPDDLMDPDPHRRVDYVCSVGESLYAFEHTGIEPFHDFIQRGIHNQALFSAVVNHFDNTRSDAEYWQLYVPFEASASVKTVQVKRVGAALIAWIEQNAAAVPVVIYGNRFRDVLAQTAAGIPFPFSLHRFSFDSIHFPTKRSPLSGRFTITYVAPDNIEAARENRLQKTCEDKFHKLATWKRSEGARTILVLEENDISLTNHQVVADAMVHAEARVVTDPLPDEVFLVSTSIADMWHVTCLRREGKNYYDDGERFHEFQPSELVKLTKR